MALREGESLLPPPARRSVDEGEPAALSEPRGTARDALSPPDRGPLGPPCSRSDGRTGTLTLSEPLEAEGDKTEGLEPLRPLSDEPLLLPELELDPLEDEGEGELELDPRSTAEPVPLPRSPELELPRCAQTDAGLSASAVTHIVASNLPRFMDHAPQWRKSNESAIVHRRIRAGIVSLYKDSATELSRMGHNGVLQTGRAGRRGLARRPLIRSAF
jgi:hypothetical protein